MKKGRTGCWFLKKIVWIPFVKICFGGYVVARMCHEVIEWESVSVIELIKTNNIKPIKMTGIAYFVFPISKGVQVYLIIIIFTFTEIKT